MIVSGAVIGLNNTLTTQAVMLVAPVERPVASAAYGFVRFIGGGLAPFVASKLVTAFNVHVPFYVGAGTVVLAIVVLATGHKLLTAAENPPEEAEEWPGEAGARIVVAVDSTAEAAIVTDAAITLARRLDSPVDVVHVLETDVVDEAVADTEPPAEADRVVAAHVDRVRAAGLAAEGHVLRVVGDHADIGRRIARFAATHTARAIVIGTTREPGASRFVHPDVTDEVVRDADCRVLVVPLGAQQPATTAG